jgi:hypothetical protein
MTTLVYLQSPKSLSIQTRHRKWPEVPYSRSAADRQAVRPHQPSRYVFLFLSGKGKGAFDSLVSTGKALGSLLSLLFDDKWGG